jgi:hypothetical protein
MFGETDEAHPPTNVAILPFSRLYVRQELWDDENGTRTVMLVGKPGW